MDYSIVIWLHAHIDLRHRFTLVSPANFRGKRRQIAPESCAA